MIKFFRNIRQRLLRENRFTRYLIYAIGEIVLVVIGILIALAINDAYSTHKVRLEEKQYLKSLKLDFLDSRQNADSTIVLQKMVVDYCEQLLIKMRDRDMSVPYDSVGLYVYRGAFSYWRLEPVNGTYDALIGAGKTDIFQNEELKRLLAEYSAKIKYGFEDEDYALQLTASLANSASSYSMDLLPNIRYTDKLRRELKDEQRTAVKKIQLENDEFLGLLNIKFGMESNRLEYQQEIRNYIQQILVIINKEISSKS